MTLITPPAGTATTTAARTESRAPKGLRALGPKFLNGFLELALSIAQSAKIRTAILQSVAARNALHVPAQVLSYLLNHCQIMVSGLRAIGRRPTAAREQNK